MPPWRKAFQAEEQELGHPRCLSDVKWITAWANGESSGRGMAGAAVGVRVSTAEEGLDALRSDEIWWEKVKDVLGFSIWVNTGER